MESYTSKATRANNWLIVVQNQRVTRRQSTERTPPPRCRDRPAAGALTHNPLRNFNLPKN